MVERQTDQSSTYFQQGNTVSKLTLARRASEGNHQTGRNRLYRFPSLALRAGEIFPGTVFKLLLEGFVVCLDLV